MKLFVVTDFNQCRLIRSKMSSIFRPTVRRAINQEASDFSLCIFGEISKVLENLKEAKEINMLISQNLIKTKNTGNGANKAGKNKGKKPVAGGSKAKNKAKSSKKKGSGSKAKAKNNSSGTKDKEDSNKEKDKDEPCKSKTIQSFESYHPSYPGSCECGTSMDSTVASIPRSTDWPVSFPLLAATEYVSAKGTSPETIISKLSKK